MCIMKSFRWNEGRRRAEGGRWCTTKGAACNKVRSGSRTQTQCTVTGGGREAEHYVGVKVEIAHSEGPTVGERELCRM